MKVTLTTITGLFLFSFFLVGEKKEVVTISEETPPQIKSTTAIIQETELYKRIEEVEKIITETENILYAEANRRPIEKPHREIFKEISNDTIHVCFLHPLIINPNIKLDGDGQRDR